MTLICGIDIPQYVDAIRTRPRISVVTPHRGTIGTSHATFGDNTTTINIAHISHVVWNKPMAGAAGVTSIFFVGGKSIDLHLTPAQIRQLEGRLADYNRRQDGKH